MKLVIVGPPHSGKSTFCHGLVKALRGVAPEIYPYRITANPDGEGAWFQDAYAVDSIEAKEYRTAYKTEHTDKFIDRIVDSVQNCESELVLVDLGGRASQDNGRIASCGTHAFILYRTEADLDEWRNFCRRARLVCLFEVLSAYHLHADADSMLGKDNIWRGSVHRLERGVNFAGRPVIVQVAKTVAGMCRAGKRGEMPDIQGEEIFSIKFDREEGVLRIQIGKDFQNDVVTREVDRRLERMIMDNELAPGEIIKVNGPASLSVAMVLGHRLARLFATVAMFDPKLKRPYKYVVVHAQNSPYQIGDLIA